MSATSSACPAIRSSKSGGWSRSNLPTESAEVPATRAPPSLSGQERPKHSNHSQRHQAGADPAQSDQPRRGFEPAHQSGVCDDHHHHHHDRNRDDTIEHGTPDQHVNGVYSGKAKPDTDNGGD